MTPDGTEIVSGSSDGSVRIWDRHTGEPRAPLTGHTGAVLTVAVTPDGTEIVSGSEDGSVRIWDRHTGEPRAPLTGHTSRVLAVAVTPDGTEIVSGSQDGSVRIWDRHTGEPRAPLTGHTSGVWAVAVTPDGTEIVSGSADGSVRIWDRRTGEPRAPLTGHTGRVLAVAVTPDGTEIVSGGSDGSVRIWDRHTGEPRAPLTGHTSRVLTVAVTPDGTEILSGSEDGSAQIWDRHTGEPRAPLTGHTSRVWAVAVTPDGTEIVSGSADGSVRIWDRHTGTPAHSRTGEPRAPLTGHTSAVRAVAVTPDGTEILSGSEDGSVRIWDRHTGEPRAPLTGHTGAVWAVAVTPDGTDIVSGGEDGSVRIWDRRTGEPRAPLTGHTSRVLAVAVTPDGTEIVSGSEDGSVRIWDRHTGEPRAPLTGHTDRVRAVAVTPDGTEIVSVGDDGSVRIWNMATGRYVRGTGVGGAGKAGQLAGLASDNPAVDDRLDLGGEVAMLAELASAIATEPPLSIGLLGEWGTGKSSFMRQVELRVNTLADASAANLGASEFVASVAQVSFNAWHYSDTYVWSGIVENLFQGLAGASSPVEATELAVGPAQAAELKQLLTREELAERQITGSLNRLSSAPASLRQLMVGHMAFVSARQFWRDLKAHKVLVFISAAAVALALVATIVLQHFVVAWMVAIVSVFGPLLLALSKVTGGVKAQWSRARSEVPKRLEEQRVEVQRRVADLRGRLAVVDGALRLQGFLEGRKIDESYMKYRGLLWLVHRDLLRLNDELSVANRLWAASRSRERPPLQRIVLYVDDLDRCPPSRVVEVLEAIHLLLAIPLFVVFVAVDPRWLLLSLESHYAALLKDVESDHGAGIVEAATPLDYLDKIFQIPFALRPMGADRAASLPRVAGPRSRAAGGASNGANGGARRGRRTRHRDLGASAGRARFGSGSFSTRRAGRSRHILRNAGRRTRRGRTPEPGAAGLAHSTKRAGFHPIARSYRVNPTVGKEARQRLPTHTDRHSRRRPCKLRGRRQRRPLPGRAHPRRHFGRATRVRANALSCHQGRNGFRHQSTCGQSDPKDRPSGQRGVAGDPPRSRGSRGAGRGRICYHFVCLCPVGAESRTFQLPHSRLPDRGARRGRRHHVPEVNNRCPSGAKSARPLRRSRRNLIPTPADPRPANMHVESPWSGWRLFTVAQTAAWLGVSRSTIYRMLNTGRLPLTEFTIGNELRLSRRQLTAWLDQTPGAPTTQPPTRSSMHRR